VPFSINTIIAAPTQWYAVDVVMLKIYIMLLAVIKSCSMIKWYVKNAIVGRKSEQRYVGKYDDCAKCPSSISSRLSLNNPRSTMI
jgi:hypothetical protein